MIKRLILAFVLIAGGAIAISANWAWRTLNVALDIPGEGVFYTVRSGASLASVTADLARQGILSHPRVVNWYARVDGSATGIKAGEYKLVPGLTPLSLLEQFGRGDVFLHQFTIVEGWRFDEMLARLRANEAVRAGIENGDEIMGLLGSEGISPEGQFLPDTYSFPRDSRDIEILRTAHNALDAALETAWNDRVDDNVLGTPYEGLILASIIEKETALADERALISGVFHERLQRNMRLQTDPSVIYGLGRAFDGNLTRVQLLTDTPYNTYTRAGLPPTPIALPGRASIVAAFSPRLSGALYFVATGDPDGSHTFSSTLEEHNAAVRRYLDKQNGRD